MANNVSEIVDRMGKLNLTGNLVPHEWHKHVGTVGKKGYKSDPLAINILSDIIYWYRPSERRNKRGLVTARVNKFEADKLQKSYQQYADLFCVTKRQVKAAFVTLTELGLVKVMFRNIRGRWGFLSNVMFVVPIADAIEKICAKEKGRLRTSRRTDPVAQPPVQNVSEIANPEPVVTPENSNKYDHHLNVGGGTK